jgi:two-component system OmpR family sensor kinase
MGDSAQGTGGGKQKHSEQAGQIRLANLTGESRNRLLATLEQLLAIDGINVRSTLNTASDLIAGAIRADKCDVFIYEPSTTTLVAFGTSHTPMGARQRQLGLDRIPIANDGPEVGVMNTGESYITGDAEQDPTIPPGVTGALGVRSIIIVPMVINGDRRGALQAYSAQRDAFSEDDLSFLQAVAHWIGALTHRAELVERISQEAATQARQVVAEELITVLAHDLSNMLTPLKARLDLVKRRVRRDNRERDVADLELASRSVNRLQALIRDLLDVGRLDQGLFSLSRQPVNLVLLVQETSEVVGTLQTVQLNILLTTPEELVVEADKARIGQALENLISNALRHSPKGAPVEVEVRSEMRPNGDSIGSTEREWAIINVHDEGPGIPADLVPRLFTRFSPGPNSTGLGLGLYLARSIAEAHGGTLTVESSPGRGTTFCMAFPTTA